MEILAVFGAVLSNNGFSPLTEKKILKKATAKAILPLMLLCGLNINSGKFVRNYGLPSTVSVSGGLLIVIP